MGGKVSFTFVFPHWHAYREQEAELLYLSYLLWWHAEPWARRGGPWWLLPLCGDRGLWSGKERKGFYIKGQVQIQMEKKPQHDYTFPHDSSSLPHLGWIHQSPQNLEKKGVPQSRLVPQHAPHFTMQLSFLLFSWKGQGCPCPRGPGRQSPSPPCHNSLTSSREQPF